MTSFSVSGSTPTDSIAAESAFSRWRARSIKLVMMSASATSMMRSPIDTTVLNSGTGTTSPNALNVDAVSVDSRRPVMSACPASLTCPTDTSARSETGVAPLKTRGTRFMSIPMSRTIMPVTWRFFSTNHKRAIEPTIAHSSGNAGPMRLMTSMVKTPKTNRPGRRTRVETTPDQVPPRIRPIRPPIAIAHNERSTQKG